MSIVRVLLALLLLLPFSAQAQPTFPKLTGRVVDAANLLSPAQEAELTALSDEVEKASSRQFVIATIPDLQGYPIEDYGYQLIRAWAIGQKDANNGIILIVAPNDRRVRIEVGYGLEPIMTDAMSGTIISDIITPRFKAGDMGGGIVAGAQAIAEQMKLPLEAAEARAKAESDKAAAKAPAQRQRKSGGFPVGLLFWGIILAFVLIPMLRSGRKSRRGPWGESRSYRRSGGDGGALPILLWTIASELSRGGHGGGSGWGGGDGGGWGGGGGGGGFSGGGGSGGGGGASGSW
ncbi:TPM domain-containing protein [Sphingomonas hengshuiensis]|uniref:Methanol dehydrogenase n=1 Tax=Sphingomonas hengshuiensis TaxID=1609977 RepID=A0A7U4JAL9_9SPHN|nr:TPM domain-containing protein [Sphingomonas hengshuiensis]AJP73283.1 methanol dehydrogenase [Sphingomonas hengshuiensis]